MVRKRPIRPRPVPVQELLRTSATAADALERQRREDGMLVRVRGLMNPDARPHCIQARVTDRILAIDMDSPAWATRVRYQAQELLAGLADPGLSEIRVRTRPAGQPSAGEPRLRLRLPRLAPATVAHLLAAADGCVDPTIGELFRRIARRRSRGSGSGAGDLPEV
jgi:hypothetical protein